MFSMTQHKLTMSSHKTDTCLVGYGYRSDEVRQSGCELLPEIPPWSKDAKFFFKRHGYVANKRQVVKTSLGVHVVGCTLPRPDLCDPDSVVDGAKKRFCHQGPTPDPAILEKLYKYNKLIIKERFVPLPADADVSVETWLSNSNYPEWRKDEIRQAERNLPELLESKKGRQKIMAVKSFIKLEDYPVFKYPRPINSRSDEFKVLVGPAMKLVEKMVFDHYSFIKKQPRDQWPSFIETTLGVDAVYKYVSDYTSYEALIEPFLMKIELDLYEYFLMTNFPEIYKWIAKIAKLNKCSFRYVLIIVLGKRMSGDMVTSLGNGWDTHVCVSFIVFMQYGVHPIILQEGDDTIFLSPGPIVPARFEELGLEVKLDRVSRIGIAQFCQLLYDVDSLRVVRDPIKYLVGFGWGGPDVCNSKKKHLLLLQAKALSALSQYPGHPIIQSMAGWVMRCSGGLDADVLMDFVIRERSFDSYSRQVYMSAVSNVDWRRLLKEVHPSSRTLVEELYGVPAPSQIQIENWFERQENLCPIPIELIYSWVCTEWLLYDGWYVRERPMNVPGIDFIQVGPTM